MAFFVPLLPYLLGVVVVLGAAWGLVGWLDGRGYQRCQVEQAAAVAEAQRQADQHYRAAVEWGNQVSSALARQQHINASLRSQHETAAHDLVGTCPVGLRHLHDAAARGVTLPEAARPSIDAPGTVDARQIGVAVAGNYALARDCQQQLNALIDYIEKQP